METLYHTHLNTPVGRLLVASSDRGLVRILLPTEGKPDPVSRLREHYPQTTLIEDRGRNQQALKQLQEYFDGTRTAFSVSLDLRGTDFQKTVWHAVAQIPYGKTSSYGEIARKIGNPKACRAVGAANGANPLPIAIPCHRIVGTDGSLTGYGGGIALKKKLLRLEQNP